MEDRARAVVTRSDTAGRESLQVRPESSREWLRGARRTPISIRIDAARMSERRRKAQPQRKRPYRYRAQHENANEYPNHCAIQPPIAGLSAAPRPCTVMTAPWPTLTRPVPLRSGRQARDSDALQPRADAVEHLHRKDAPGGDQVGGDKAADRQGDEGDQEDEPIALFLGHRMATIEATIITPAR